MDTELAVRLRRLDAHTEAVVPFGYDALLDRQAARATNAQRRYRVARATAGALVIAMVGASLWRLEPRPAAEVGAVVPVTAPAASLQPRIVRADTYLAVAALEDHIARLDDALNDARLQGSDDVPRLERTRAELVNSYASVRYAEMVSANF